MADFIPIIDFSLQAEGGWSNDPEDPGGATNMGITLDGWSANLGRQCTVAELRAMTREQAVAYYRIYYAEPMGVLSLPAGIDLVTFDFGINAGPGRSIEMLQRIVGSAADGRVGPETLARACGSAAVTRARIVALGNAHEAYYHSLPGYAHDGRGWTARVNACLTAALGLAANGVAPMVAPALPKPRPKPAGKPAAVASVQQSAETADDLDNQYNPGA